MYSSFKRRHSAAFFFLAATAILTACNGGSSTLTPVSPAKTPAASPSAAPSTTAVASASPSPTASASAPASPTPTASASTAPSATPVITATPVVTATPAITATPSAAPTASPTVQPSATPVPTPSATVTPTAVASDSETGTSRVDGSNAADTDINVSTGATLPSGDTIALSYYMDATNGTYSAPTLSTNFFLSNPGSFAVSGKVFAATQAVLAITPTQVTFENNGGAATELYLAYNVVNSTNPSLTPGANFTCTIFDGNTVIGSTSTVVGGGTSNGVTNSFAECTGVYPSTSGYTTGNGHAFVNLPATYNSSDTYTFVISH